jgi:hypothetical protein
MRAAKAKTPPEGLCFVCDPKHLIRNPAELDAFTCQQYEATPPRLPASLTQVPLVSQKSLIRGFLQERWFHPHEAALLSTLSRGPNGDLVANVQVGFLPCRSGSYK